MPLAEPAVALHHTSQRRLVPARPAAGSWSHGSLTHHCRKPSRRRVAPRSASCHRIGQRRRAASYHIQLKATPALHRRSLPRSRPRLEVHCRHSAVVPSRPPSCSRENGAGPLPNHASSSTRPFISIAWCRHQHPPCAPSRARTRRCSRRHGPSAAAAVAWWPRRS